MLAVPHERAPGFAEHGIIAFTTTREAGTYALGSAEPAAAVFERWSSLARELSALTPRLASASQVHGVDILEHSPTWHGWLRAPAADGHAAFQQATGMCVSLADCVPIFIGHPSGAAAILHSGWRGTAAGIAARAVSLFARQGMTAHDLIVHLGPAICGECYEVGPEVLRALTGQGADAAATISLRGVISAQLSQAGVRAITSSPFCTRHNNDRFFSHRAGDDGRQLGVIVSRGDASLTP